MTKEKMIDRIYEIVAEKYKLCTYCKQQQPNRFGECYCSYGRLQIKEDINYKPVMIGDVLERLQKYTKVSKERKYKEMMVLATRKQKRKPIEEQSEECVLFIYELICTTTTND